MATCVPSEVLAAAKCFDCLSPKRLLVAQTVLISRFVESGPIPPEAGEMLFEDGEVMAFQDGVLMDFET